jgi:restriction system protein
VGVTTVRELYGVMAAEGATGGFVVTSGRFTHEAGAFAAGRNIQLMDGDGLMSLLSEGRANRAARPRSATSTRDVSEPARPRAAVEPESPSLSPEIAAEPNCPRCAKPMVRRIAKKGPAAGKGFWGCSDYSAGCRGTREI